MKDDSEMLFLIRGAQENIIQLIMILLGTTNQFHQRKRVFELKTLISENRTFLSGCHFSVSFSRYREVELQQEAFQVNILNFLKILKYIENYLYFVTERFGRRIKKFRKKTELACRNTQTRYRREA